MQKMEKEREGNQRIAVVVEVVKEVHTVKVWYSKQKGKCMLELSKCWVMGAFVQIAMMVPSGFASFVGK